MISFTSNQTYDLSRVPWFLAGMSFEFGRLSPFMLARWRADFVINVSAVIVGIVGHNGIV